MGEMGLRLTIAWNSGRIDNKTAPSYLSACIGMFIRLVIARIAPYFPPVRFAPPARQSRHGPNSGNGFPEKSCCHQSGRI